MLGCSFVHLFDLFYCLFIECLSMLAFFRICVGWWTYLLVHLDKCLFACLFVRCIIIVMVSSFLNIKSVLYCKLIRWFLLTSSPYSSI